MSSTFQLQVNNGVATLSLDRGRSNAINHQMIKELLPAIADIENNAEIGGLIITGKEGFFTSGVDLIEAYSYDEQQIRAFWTDFLALAAALASFKKPMIAAISGHSPAGGCVMAICADYRLMAEGDYIIGLNEVPVGIVVPQMVFSLYAFWLGERVAYQSLLQGKLFKAAEALQAGLVDALLPAADLLPAAERQLKALMKLNKVTWCQTKQNLRKHLLDQINTDQSPMIDIMLKQWWAPETRQGLLLMIENLKSKKAS
jgi:enoyl-CoA hydratase/carnithine racemase